MPPTVWNCIMLKNSCVKLESFLRSIMMAWKTEDDTTLLVWFGPVLINYTDDLNDLKVILALHIEPQVV
jgi:hypothetical protein